jgi:hypothetical protein
MTIPHLTPSTSCIICYRANQMQCPIIFSFFWSIIICTGDAWLHIPIITSLYRYSLSVSKYSIILCHNCCWWHKRFILSNPVNHPLRLGQFHCQFFYDPNPTPSLAYKSKTQLPSAESQLLDRNVRFLGQQFYSYFQQGLGWLITRVRNTSRKAIYIT